MHYFQKLYHLCNYNSQLQPWLLALPELLHLNLANLKHNRVFRSNESIIERLPVLPDAKIKIGDCLEIIGEPSMAQEQATQALLTALQPWRKGPFKIYNNLLDAEWRCNLKWRRLQQAVDLQNKLVLDVGCGNGYYMWQMLQERPSCVVGVDPTILFWQQFRAIEKLTNQDNNIHFIPLTLEALPAIAVFDTVFSMGVLYHRKSPIEHLFDLKQMLKPNGQLILETLVIDSLTTNLLTPLGTYAKMNNVWFIPSVDLLVIWLKKCGFSKIEIVDISTTSTAEQRQTPWMQNYSLADFLDPKDMRLTIEGHPAPKRVVISAQKS